MPRAATLASVWAALVLVPATYAGPAGPGTQTLKGHVPDVVAGLTALKPLPADQRLKLALALPLRNPAGLTALLGELYDPASPRFHEWLTPAQFTASFGPTQADYEAVAAWAQARGLQVTVRHPNRVLLDVEGSLGAIEAALHVTLQVYPHPSEARTFYAPEREPWLDLAVPLAHVSGLDNYSPPRSRMKPQPLGQGTKPVPHGGSGPSGSYMAGDFRAAYLPDVTLTGVGQTVGLLQFDGYASSDIAYYTATNHLPPASLSNVLLDGFDGTPTGTGGEVEVCLDIEMVLSMAPNASIYVYEAGPNGVWHDVLNRMANDNLAKSLSCSWYIPGGAMDSVADGIFQQMAAQGQSFYDASGDDDAFCGLIPFPGDTPYITQVGGTLLATTGPGGAYSSEAVWNRYNGTGSGGGISTQYAIPTWQQGLDMSANHGSTTMRNVPDVALTADQVYVRADGVDQTVGGTSAAAPLWAGFTALLNQQATGSGRPTIGWLNPAIYLLGQSGNYHAALHDVTVGNNTNSGCGPSMFPGVPGYDLATGWGTPLGQASIDAIAGPPDDLQIRPSTGFSSSGGVGGPFSVTSQNFTLTNGGVATLHWLVANPAPWLNVSLTNGTLAAGAVTTLTISLNGAASNLVAASYLASVGFTNLTSGFGQSRVFSLAVLGAPVITNQPVNQTVLSGGTASFSVGVMGLPPLYYQWSFLGAELPGATNPSLTLSSVTTNQAGSYSVLVTNSLGATNSAAAQLTVIPSAANDLCGNAVVINSSSFSYVESTTNATSSGDPSPACVSSAGNGVWFEYTPATNVSLTLDTVGSSFDTVLAVYTGACGALTQVGCDDDSGGNFTSRISLLGVANTTYHILAAGYGGATGNLTFHLANSIVATNDTCATATVITSNNYTNTQSTATATSTGDPTPPCLSTFGKGVWYQFTPAASGILAVDTVGSSFDTALGLYSGSCGSLAYVNCNDDSGSSLTSRITNSVSGGVTYYILAGGYSSASGTLVLHLLFTSPTGPPVIVTPPTNQVVVSGGTARFTVGATGTAPLSYSWRRNGAPIAGATLFSYATNNVQMSDSGAQFSCLVSNSLGTALSSSAALSVVDGSSVVAYFTDNFASQTGPGGVITTAGYTPMYVSDISNLNLSGLHTLFLDEYGNSALSSALASRLAELQTWVSNGGKLIVHDRSAGNLNPNPFLFGSAGSATVRFTSSDLDVIPPATNLVVAGPFGTIDNSTLDGGSYSSHGYVTQATLPATAYPILSVGGSPSEVVAFAYPLGSGAIYYGAMPLDCYLAAGDCDNGGSLAHAFQNIYGPNVLRFMAAFGGHQIRFLSISRAPTGEVQLTISGVAGDVYRVQASTALSPGNWQTIGTVTNISGTVQFTSTPVSGQQNYYRCVFP